MLSSFVGTLQDSMALVLCTFAIVFGNGACLAITIIKLLSNGFLNGFIYILHVICIDLAMCV